MIEMLYHCALLSVLANPVLQRKLQFISCLARAQSGFSAGNAFQKCCWIHALILDLCWSARQDAQIPSLCTFNSCPHRIFLDTDTSGISQPITMMIMLAMLDAEISPASNYIQSQYKNSHQAKIKISI